MFRVVCAVIFNYYYYYELCCFCGWCVRLVFNYYYHYDVFRVACVFTFNYVYYCGFCFVQGGVRNYFFIAITVASFVVCSGGVHGYF